MKKCFLLLRIFSQHRAYPLRLDGGAFCRTFSHNLCSGADVLPYCGIPYRYQYSQYGMHHIVTLPLGFMDSFGSGKMRKIVNESSAATETYRPSTAGQSRRYRDAFGAFGITVFL